MSVKRAQGPWINLYCTLFRCIHYNTVFHTLFAEQRVEFLTSLSIQVAMKTHFLSAVQYLLISRVFIIDQIAVAAVAMFMQWRTSQTEWVQRKHCYNLVFPAGAHLEPEMCVFFSLSLAVILSTFLYAVLLHFHLLSTKDNVDMSLHCQFRSSQIGLWFIMS